MLIRFNGTNEVYDTSSGKLDWIKSPDEMAKRGLSFADVKVIDPKSVPLTKAANDDKIYANVGGQQVWVPDPETFTKSGFDWRSVKTTPVPTNNQNNNNNGGSGNGSGTQENGQGSGSGTNNGSSSGSSNAVDIDTQLKSYGIDPATLSPAEKSVFNALIAVGKLNASNNKPVAVNNADDFKKYYDQALTMIEPEYQAQAQLGRKDFDTAIATLTGDYNQLETNTKIQQEAEKTQLQDQMAEAGLAYSGIRKKAQDNMETMQTGVVQSNKRQLEKNINQLGSAYESKFGSSGFPGINISGSSYNPSGGIFGSQNYDKQNKAINYASEMSGVLPYAQDQSAMTTKIINPIQ